MGAGAAAATELGTARNPIYTMQAEPSVKAQIWRTVRTLAVMFVIISGLGALMEERGLSRGILNSPDMRPQLESKTRFADVKGVDEAKVTACLQASCTASILHGSSSVALA